MVASSPCHGPRCRICQRFFTPDARQGEGQRLCGRASCRREYKNEWQRLKYAGDLPRARAAVRMRVRRHRWNRRGQAVAAPAAAADAPAMAGALVRLEAVLTGLAALALGCRNGPELGQVLSRCLDHGRDLLGGTMGAWEKERCNGTRSRGWTTM